MAIRKIKQLPIQPEPPLTAGTVEAAMGYTPADAALQLASPPLDGLSAGAGRLVVSGVTYLGAAIVPGPYTILPGYSGGVYWASADDLQSIYWSSPDWNGLARGRWVVTGPGYVQIAYSEEAVASPDLVSNWILGIGIAGDLVVACDGLSAPVVTSALVDGTPSKVGQGCIVADSDAYVCVQQTPPKWVKVASLTRGAITTALGYVPMNPAYHADNLGQSLALFSGPPTF